MFAVRGKGFDQHFAQRDGYVLIAEITGVLTGDREIEDRPQTVHVRSLVRETRVLLLLRRAIAQRQQLLAGYREFVLFGPHQPCEPEVYDLRLARLVEQNVARLEVPVNDAILVGIGNGPANLDQQTDGIDHRELAIAGDVLIQRKRRRREAGDPLHRLIRRARRHAVGAGDIFHHDVRAVGILPQGVHMDNIDVVESGNRARLLQKSLAQALDSLRLPVEPLDRHIAAKAPVTRQIDHAHSTVTDTAHHRILAEQRFAPHRVRFRPLLRNNTNRPRAVFPRIGPTRIIRGEAHAHRAFVRRVRRVFVRFVHDCLIQ